LIFRIQKMSPKLPYLLDCKMRFFPYCGAWICEVILNSHMKRQTRPCQTGPCRAKPRPASPNHVRSVLFWDIRQSRMGILQWHSGTTCQSQLQGSRNPKERTQHDRCLLTQSSFLGLPLRLSYSQSLGTTETVIVKIYGWEQI